jgi:hypothetical protein
VCPAKWIACAAFLAEPFEASTGLTAAPVDLPIRSYGYTLHATLLTHPKARLGAD